MTKEKPGRIFNERREGAGEDAVLIAVDDALVQFVAEGLPAAHPTLFRWAQQWAIEKPEFAIRTEDRRLWLTQEGFAEARKLLIPRALTKVQTALGKDKEAARKFTARHKLSIQTAITRGDKLEDIAKALLSQGNEPL